MAVCEHPKVSREDRESRGQLLPDLGNEGMPSRHENRKTA